MFKPIWPWPRLPAPRPNEVSEADGNAVMSAGSQCSGKHLYDWMELDGIGWNWMGILMPKNIHHDMSQVPFSSLQVH